MQEATKIDETPAEWIEKYFYVPDVRDPITGTSLGEGPIRLAEHQKRIINEALSRLPDGTLKYRTVIYSAPKKSGKSALSSAIALYMAYHNPNAFIACLANDGKQSADRIYGPIHTNFRLHRQLGGTLANENPLQSEITLSNFTKIEAIPCDAAGEAGSQPLLCVWSELWGFDTPKKKMLWTEMTLPPTLEGRALRWVESYAGFVGKSELLEDLYNVGVREAEPHPDFRDMDASTGPVVWVNGNAKMFTYWDTEPRMIWQTPDYYRTQAAVLSPSEFDRIHRNQWVTAMEAFIQPQWWDSCYDETLPPLPEGGSTPVVLAIDAAVTQDCCAIIATTRCPHDPESAVAVRAVRIFTPHSGPIILRDTIEKVLRAWCARWNVVCVTYDPYQMAKLAQDLTREGLAWFLPFGQQTSRSVADKKLYDLIIHQQIKWGLATEGDVGQRGDGRETLYKHLVQAGANTSGNAYRIVKLSANSHVDAAVALSMAAYQTMRLALDNREFNREHLLQELQRGKITIDEFTRRMQQTYPLLAEREK